MIKRKIKNVKELPDWYDLTKYQGASDLNASSWYELALQRWNHFFWMKRRGVAEYKTRVYSDGSNPLYSALLQSREDPLSLLTDEMQIVLMGGGQLMALKYDVNDFVNFSYGVMPLTFRRLYQLERKLENTSRKRIRLWMDAIFDDTFEVEDDQFKEECDWAKSFIDTPMFEVTEKEGVEKEGYNEPRTRDVVEIDLSTPDKVLIQQFEGYLRYVRQKHPNVKKARRYKYPEYQKWVDYAVLPYLDLTLWANEMGVSIPYRVMADAIYSGGDKGEETVRKTTSKIANNFMDKEHIDFLATIAAHEIAENK